MRRTDGTVGLMGHVIADFPSPGEVRQMIAVMADAGVQVIEIQIPFSEPMADGPLFLAANHAALKAGVDYAASRRLMAEARARHPEVQFVFMTYLNIVYKRGYAAFAADASKAGAAGVIIPDLPFDLATELEAALASVGLANIRLATPNAGAERLKVLAEGARGLIYAVARSGVTGAATSFGDDVRAFARHVRNLATVPVAVGFGVRTPDDVRDLREAADLVVVGTASLKAYLDGGLAAFTHFWRGLAEAAAD